MDWTYVVKHWLFTLTISPLVLEIIEEIMPYGEETTSVLGIYPVILIFSCILSIPTLIAYIIAYNVTRDLTHKTNIIKSILILVTVIGMIITFGAIGISPIYEFSISYSITAIVIAYSMKMQIHQRSD